MPGFFEALENFKPQKRQPHVVTIEGLSIVVSLERKLEIMQAGEDAYMWQKGEVVKKKRIPAEQQQPLMYKADKRRSKLSGISLPASMYLLHIFHSFVGNQCNMCGVLRHILHMSSNIFSDCISPESNQRNFRLIFIVIAYVITGTKFGLNIAKLYLRYIALCVLSNL